MSLYARLRAYRRVLISDIDGTLLPDAATSAATVAANRRASASLGERLLEDRAALVLASGRNLPLSLGAVSELTAAGLPRPAALIASVGSEIYLGDGNEPDEEWAAHIAQGWEREALRAALAGVDDLRPQGDEGQGPFKLSYVLPADQSVALRVVQTARQRLVAAGLRARLIHSAGELLDVLPLQASKGAAVAWLLSRAAIDPKAAITAGDSGNDREMLLSAVAGVRLKAVVVANHRPELADLAELPQVYFAQAEVAAGVLEGVLAHGW